LYHAYTSLRFAISRCGRAMMTILINCKNRLNVCQRALPFSPASREIQDFIAIANRQTATFCQLSLSLDEWRSNFYDPKLILKHIIWIHFTMHSFIADDTCVERERERALGLGALFCFFMFVLCCECVWHLIKLHIWVNVGARMMLASSFSL
jgi:hypothetical protein